MEKIISEFLEHKKEMDRKERKGDESYGIEFIRLRELNQLLKSDFEYSTSEGEKPQNIVKNRYKDILPFDRCRVKLQQITDSDYINASFINSPTQQRYIATQGPLPRTLEDFWDMAWQQEVSTIVMACLENEGFPPKNKCQRYWGSADDDLLVGPYTIKLLEEFMVPGSEESISRKRLLVARGGEERILEHIHHTVWPDKLIPTCVTSILFLISTIRSIHPSHLPQPLLVHCSAGCGRTGTIIVIDYIRTLLLTNQLPQDFSIYEVVGSMRRQRTAMVQTQEQYHYVHMEVERMFQEYLDMKQAGVYAVVGESVNTLQCRSPAKSPDLSPTTFKPLYSTVSLNRKIATRTESVEKIDVADDDAEQASISPMAHKQSLKKQISSPSPSPPPPPPPSPPSNHSPKFFRGYDIGYPNRVARPQGPRPMPVSLR